MKLFIAFSASLFIDGAEDFKIRFAAIKDDNAYEIKLGYGARYYPSKSAYTGHMKDVIYYQAALSKEIIRTLIKKEKPPGIQLFDSGNMKSRRPVLRNI